MTSKSKGAAVDEKTLMTVLSAVGVSKTDVPKLHDVTGLPFQVVMEALRQLIARGLVGVGSDPLVAYYYLTEKGYKLVQRL